MQAVWLRSLSGVVALLAATGACLAQTGLREKNIQVAQGRAAAQTAPAQPAPAPTPPPQPYKTEILNFDNWTVTCRDFAEGKRKHICFAALQIIQQNNNQVVFSWTIGTDDENRQLMTFQSPTGVAITPGITLKLTKGEKTVPYTACETGHCLATLPLDANLVREITATPDAQAIIHASDGRDVQINIPTKGFDKAYAALPK